MLSMGQLSLSDYAITVQLSLSHVTAKNCWELLWRPTSPGNEDVLICINAPFITQRILKSWWSWTYQNSAVKRASARVIPRWVISWEVWFGKPKADNIVSLGVGRYNSIENWGCSESTKYVPIFFISITLDFAISP